MYNLLWAQIRSLFDFNCEVLCATTLDLSLVIHLMKLKHETKYLNMISFAFFSENLATEMEVWKDMKKLKHLPTPLSQKKNLRLQYQVHTK